MLLEETLANWLRAGLKLYQDTPELAELVFQDDRHVGIPTELTANSLGDSTKAWLPDEFVDGQVRWGGDYFPITGNTLQTLMVTGDPSAVYDGEQPQYHILFPTTLRFQQLLAQPLPKVFTSWPQMPTEFPCFTIRLQSDVQAQTWISEDMVSSVVTRMVGDPPAEQGYEYDVNHQLMTGQYIISIYSLNRDETLWLYAWLHNYALGSVQLFSTWGLSEISLGGTDLDPITPYFPEKGYVRHFMFSASRPERAANILTLARIDRLQVHGELEYAKIRIKEALP